MDNFLRTLVKTDPRPAKEIAKRVGLSANTITLLTKPDLVPFDKRLNDSLTRLARFYGYDVRVRLDFVPLDNGDE